MSDRAVVFIDGNNWYHACKSCGVRDLSNLDYGVISKKLLGPRSWLGTRYYIGALKHYHNNFREQRQFLSRIQNQDRRITVHLGRIEERPQVNELAVALLKFLDATTLDPAIRSDLSDLAVKHKMVSLLKEKAADVMLAVEMHKLAVDDRYDSAYLLSADGDFTPAVQAVRDLGKKVYCASPLTSNALKSAANTFIPIDLAWFRDCYAHT